MNTCGRQLDFCRVFKTDVNLRADHGIPNRLRRIPRNKQTGKPGLPQGRTRPREGTAHAGPICSEVVHLIRAKKPHPGGQRTYKTDPALYRGGLLMAFMKAVDDKQKETARVFL